MARIGIALDVGTSCYKAQKIDLDTQEVMGTAMTLHNPLPGANAIDQRAFAAKWPQMSHELCIMAVKRLIVGLGVYPYELERMAICGNAVQVSIFLGLTIDDLLSEAAGAPDSCGTVDRGARILDAADIDGLKKYSPCHIVVPPAARNRIGADKLALVMYSGLLEGEDSALAMDFGIGTKVALKVGGVVYTGSVASGTGLGGQGLSYGTVAKPQSVCDFRWEDDNLRAMVLDDGMHVTVGDLFDPLTGTMIEQGQVKPFSIAGSGSVSLISAGMERGFIVPPRIRTASGSIDMRVDLRYDEADLALTGIAIGKVRAACRALTVLAGIEADAIHHVYTSGAIGTYADPDKAKTVGLLPDSTTYVTQIGNTSLQLARELVNNPGRAFELEAIADSVPWHWVAFERLPTYVRALECEHAFWEDGISPEGMASMCAARGIPKPNPRAGTPLKVTTLDRDIPEMGKGGLKIRNMVDTCLHIKVEGCTGCFCCTDICKNNAIKPDTKVIHIRTDLCSGLGCQKCQMTCSTGVINWDRIELGRYEDETKWMPAKWKHTQNKVWASSPTNE